MKIKIGKSYIQFNEDDCNESELVIEDIYVSKNKRKKGLGKRLVAQAVEYFQNSDYTKLTLCASSTDGSIEESDLIRFYQSCGFGLIGGTIMEY